MLNRKSIAVLNSYSLKNENALGYISTKAGVFTVPGEKRSRNELQFLVLGVGKLNVYFDEPYKGDTGAVVVPACMSYDGETIALASARPVFKNSAGEPTHGCTDCELNKYNDGKRKKCQNKLRLYGVLKDSKLLAHNVLKIILPVMSVPGFLQYAQHEELDAFYAKIVIKPDPKSMFKLCFSRGDKNTKPLATAKLLTKIDNIIRLDENND